MLRTLLTAVLAFVLAGSQVACTTTPSSPADDGRVHVTILHFNDIYEITPVAGGKEGGIARVATLGG